MVGSSGNLTFCTSQTVTSGSGVTTQLKPAGSCIDIQNVSLSPVTDKWTTLPVANTFTTFFFDTVNGHLIQCASADLSVTLGIATTHGAVASCANFGNVTP